MPTDPLFPPEGRPEGYTLGRMADLLDVPRRTLVRRADAGDIDTRAIQGTGNQARRFVPWLEAVALIQEKLANDGRIFPREACASSSVNGER